ncbi:MAG: hypothetical protein JSV30_00690 [Candidatus Omnitrophota bacterium]|nr:MAG: hypothetical protein JSV30_00690 [Candidatus Omnitrophota bacterium]
MRKVLFVVFVLISVFSAVLVIAKDNGNEEEVPNGMEVLEAGNVRFIVPKGTKMKQEGNVVTVEDISAYSARRFLEMEGRFTGVEEDLKVVKKQVAHIEEHLAKIAVGDEEIKKQVEDLKTYLDEMKKEQ